MTRARAQPALYSARELAALAGCGPWTVRREVRLGRLACVRSPSGYFMSVPGDAARDWVLRRKR